MKKRLNVISLLFLLLFFSYCGKEDKQQIEPQGSSVHAALAEIDSLMWRQPDSAFALLLQFVGSPEADGLDTYNGHYCQLLISELLYKNDCEQTNRQDLQKAVAYFDSIMQVPEPVEGPSFKRNVFLTARAHYITGVGYYERDSVVEACAEYLKALETMEEHHEEQELVGKKAQFMTYIYNRLGDMFKEQLLAEPAIACYKQALFYCRREPTSKYGIPVLLYNLGIQYDIVDQTDSAALYYDEALANMPDFDNLHYRDLVSNKAIFAFYNLDYSSDSVIKILKQLVTLSADEEERTTRLLTLGHILFEDKQFDSSRVYLETLFEQEEEDITSQLMAAECLSSIYQMEGDSVKAHKYASFLAGFTMSEIEKKKEVSRINEMFKNHLAQKQEKQAEVNREKAIKKVIKIIIPIVVVIVVVIVVMAKLRSKKLLRQQQEEADRSIEAERQAHRMEQAAMSGRLKRKNEEVRELKDQIKKMDDLAAKTEMAASFNEEPICRLIMERVHEGQFKSKIDYIIYKDSALDKQQLLDLRLAVDRHFGQFTIRLKKTYPELTNSDLDYCCLYLLGLTDADIAALMQRTYNTVFERNRKMRKIFGSENPLPITLMGMAKDSLFI
jgi:tetratricopeptide (TPR) repeat protein